ncbi:hypothetical protein HanRHA438_Chr12g0533051 [Helianthus annuus]|nr:hypothetical protein HanIR_Chr12g0561801 [Helianthus annuus]KAJ0864731.1 hypothetical protein HanRHA438_Chr12g0533051 [Helianthus annuus]
MRVVRCWIMRSRMLDGFWGWLIHLWMVAERDIVYYLLLVFGVCVLRLVFVAAFVRVSEVRVVC